MSDYDVVVIGSGPAGYVAAIRCAQLGLKTACVEKNQTRKGNISLGGVCLNVGCIPSKALLDSSHHVYSLKHDLKQHGISVKDYSIDLVKMMKRKNGIVKALTAGIETLFLKNKVTSIQGQARLLSNNRIQINRFDKPGETKEIGANHIIIATGSSPRGLDMAPFDGEHIVDSSDALSFDKVPKRLGVIGGGVIGLELGSVWNRMGAKTTILNRGENFLKSVDKQIASLALKELQSQGLDIKLGATIKEISVRGKSVSVIYETSQGEYSEAFDKLLVATGRVPNSDGLNAEAAGLHVNQRGFIEVDDQCRTSLQGVYAIGDVVRGPMLAHKASEEGVAVAERIAGQYSEVDFNTVPWVIYTWPEISWVGKTTEQLDEKGIEYNVGVFPFAANGRAMAMGASSGIVKVLSDKNNDEILGVHIMGPNASELISEAVVAMETSASAEDIARIVHAHPTLSEALHEAAMAVDNRAIHM